MRFVESSEYPRLPESLVNCDCKCCGASSLLHCCVDFNRHCNLQAQPLLLPCAGISVSYYRCPECGFLFTPSFDELTAEDFKRFIYNDIYIDLDGDYGGVRAGKQAEVVGRSLSSWKDLAILDYGSGNGTFAANMLSQGFSDVTSYDPYVKGFQHLPKGSFDLITCFEVVEHAILPRTPFSEMCSLLSDKGVILFTTMLQPEDIALFKSNWWYLAPRNGHVSLHTSKSLELIGSSLGMRLGSMGKGVHWFYDQVPDFAAPILERFPK